MRRKVSFCEAVYEGSTEVEGVQGRLIERPEQAKDLWQNGIIPMLVDPECTCKDMIKPDVLVDAIMAKKILAPPFTMPP